MQSEQDTPQTPLRRMIDVFMLDCESRRLTNQTRAYYQRRLKQFATYCDEQGIARVDQITPADLRRYFAAMVERNLAEDSQATAARVIRGWLNFLVREEVLDKSPMAKVRMPRPSKRILPAFEESEVAKLLDATGTSRDGLRDRAIILVLLDSGLRVSELCGLNVGDIDTQDGTVFVRQGKGKKDRTCFVGAKARKALLRYLLTADDVANDSPLFTNEATGERITHSGIRQMCRRLKKRCGLQDVTPHKFRRTFCLWSLRAGMDLVSLSRIMGHEDTSLIRRYAAQLTDDLRAAHRAHSPLDSAKGLK